jgi:hypothetical protein
MLTSDPTGNPYNIRTILILLTVIFFPVLFGVLYMFFDWTFFGLSPRVFMSLCVVIPIIFASVIGYPQFFMKALKGSSATAEQGQDSK